MEHNEILETFKKVYEILYYGLNIAELGVAGVVLVYGIIAGLIIKIFEMIISLLFFVLESIPLYKISKKMKRKSAWLVWLSWLPVVGKYISTYVFVDIPGDKPVNLTNKITIENRLLSFWIHIGISIFGTAIITAFVGIVNIIPVLGQVVGSYSTLLYLVPTAAGAWIEFAYLRDVLDIFNKDWKRNRTVAIVIAALDALVTFGFARAFYLYAVMNKAPLVEAEDVNEGEKALC